MDSRETTLKGGDSGAALVAGDPEKSLLVEAVRYKNHDLQMPPKKRLSDSEINTLETWIKMGAPDPRTAAASVKSGRIIDINEGRKFWSFAPLSRVEPPVIPNAETPIDAFIQEKLNAQRLPSAVPADKRTFQQKQY